MSIANATAEPARHFASTVNVRLTKMLINGKWIDFVTGRTFETINPTNGKPIASIAEGGESDVDKAIKGDAPRV